MTTAKAKKAVVSSTELTTDKALQGADGNDAAQAGTAAATGAAEGDAGEGAGTGTDQGASGTGDTGAGAGDDSGAEGSAQGDAGTAQGAATGASPDTAPISFEKHMAEVSEQSFPAAFDPAPEFPRLMSIVNDTPIPYVIAKKYVAAHTAETVIVNDDAEIVRIQTDCKQVMGLSGLAEQEVPAVRVVEIE